MSSNWRSLLQRIGEKCSENGTTTNFKQHTVFLHDWWLIKAQGKGLAVGGFASRETHGVRLFCSAAISMRLDANTLKATDGITITISGFINRSRMHQNGFPFEVCNHFLFGFPYYWKEYAARCFGEESHNGCVPTKVSAFDEFSMSSSNMGNSLLPVSLDDLPVTRTRDLLMSTLEDSESCALTKIIFNDILEKFSDKAFQHIGVSIHSKKDTINPTAMVDSVPDETPSVHKKAKVHKYKDKNGILYETDMRTEEFHKIIYQSKIGMDVLTPTPSRGVATRSMTRLMNVRNNQVENPSLCTSMNKGINDLSSSSEATRKQRGGIVTKGSVSNVSHGTILYGEEKGVKGVLDSSSSRRSSTRLKNIKK